MDEQRENNPSRNSQDSESEDDSVEHLDDERRSSDQESNPENKKPEDEANNFEGGNDDDEVDEEKVCGKLTDEVFSLHESRAIPPNFTFITEPPKSYEGKTYTNPEEYFSDLREWLFQASFWSNVNCSFPFYLLSQLSATLPKNCDNCGSYIKLDNTELSFTFLGRDEPFADFVQQVATERAEQQANERNVPQHEHLNDSTDSDEEAPVVFDGIVCGLPPLWKRVVAEIIDFFILFILKILVSLIAIDVFDLIDPYKYDPSMLTGRVEYKLFLEMTYDFVVIEIIHRFFVVIYEALFIMDNWFGGFGGATPGKALMKLRVVKCDSVNWRDTLPDQPNINLTNRVLIRPASSPGFLTSLSRSLTKNMTMIFALLLLFPASFMFIYNNHYRTGYDMICGTVVVEEPIRKHVVRYRANVNNSNNNNNNNNNNRR